MMVLVVVVVVVVVVVAARRRRSNTHINSNSEQTSSHELRGRLKKGFFRESVRAANGVYQASKSGL